MQAHDVEFYFVATLSDLRYRHKILCRLVQSDAWVAGSEHTSPSCCINTTTPDLCECKVTLSLWWQIDSSFLRFRSYGRLFSCFRHVLSAHHIVDLRVDIPLSKVSLLSIDLTFLTHLLARNITIGTTFKSLNLVFIKLRFWLQPSHFAWIVRCLNIHIHRLFIQF